ncbi:hypothetical protein EAO71_13535 [Streptomyces sp. ms191]|uniref:hypothetical protein n=1 Tax=Streptomyces sp. ms191 TaxID=1827978 RepID=UPI0011CE54B0|nr:hypothetical protein [Streptomyces sp. ms191]TXS29659.1 hypothetical protein EAO71_13535 [Streptomyces sp. ms191]
MPTRIRHGLVAVLAVSALSLTAACGGSSDDDAAKGADKPATATTAAEPTSAAPAVPLTADAMKAAALEAKDLPSGWKAGKAESDPTTYKADKPACEPLTTLLADKVAGATTGASVHFERGNGDSTLDQQVLTFPGTGAADHVKAIGTALDTCTGFTAEMEGMKMKITLQKLSAPQGAEQVQTFRMKMNIAEYNITAESNVLVAAQGTGLTRFAHIPADASGHKDFDGVAETVVEKFAKAAQG